MSAAGDKIKEKLKQQGKEDLTLQMLKDFGYVIEG